MRTFIKEVRTHRATIYIAGDIEKAKEICRDFCNDIGMCVTVTPTTYIYTNNPTNDLNGTEEGMAIGFINYARFPRSCRFIDDKAIRLAQLLLDGLEQDSVSIVSDNNTIWLTNREEDME